MDLVVTNKPNVIVDSKTLASLDYYCHHHIVYCKMNFRKPPRHLREKFDILISIISCLHE